jgi:hypothetical protein
MIEMKLGQSTSKSTTDFDPFKAHVSLTSPTLLDKDIVIAMSCVGLDKPRCMVEAYSPAEGAQEFTHAYALTLVPRFELPPLPSQGEFRGIFLAYLNMNALFRIHLLGRSQWFNEKRKDGSSSFCASGKLIRAKSKGHHTNYD